jgi:hypothetical protein
VISGPYTKENVKNDRKDVLYSPTGDKITMRGYRVLTSAECTTIIIAELTVTSGRSGILFQLDGYWMGLVW